MCDRRVLILCDGKRGPQELALLLGPQTPQLIQQLSERGYLAAASLTTGMNPARAPAPQTPRPLPASPPAPMPVSAPAAARRSLVAARMYMIGMLELQRHESAATHRLCLQRTGNDPHATLAHLLAAVHCLQRIANASLAQRVRERLLEVLPEECLPAMEALPALSETSAA